MEECRPAELTAVVKTHKHAGMSRPTMSFALPESMREYIDNPVASGNYGNTSEYIRDLVRRDQEEQAKKRLRDLIEAGPVSTRPRQLRGSCPRWYRPPGDSTRQPEKAVCSQTSIDCWAKIPAIAPCDDAWVTEGKKGVARSPAA